MASQCHFWPLNFFLFNLLGTQESAELRNIENYPSFQHAALFRYSSEVLCPGAFCEYSRGDNSRSVESSSWYENQCSFYLSVITVYWKWFNILDISVADVKNHPVLIHCKRGKVLLISYGCSS